MTTPGTITEDEADFFGAMERDRERERKERIVKIATLVESTAPAEDISLFTCVRCRSRKAPKSGC